MTRPFTLGLTGSIGMGKSTTAAFFADAGIAVWDADSAVHRLYAKGGAAVAPLSALFPEAQQDGAISRPALKTLLVHDPANLQLIEKTVHPLVAADRAAFVAAATGDLVLLDIPLLFETGAEALLDATLLVTCPPGLQRQRVLSRPGMTRAQFDLLSSRQMPDRQKRGLASHIVETLDLAATRAYVHSLIAHIRSGEGLRPHA